MPFPVLFVCTGNICRSPAAHAVFARHLAAQPWAALVSVDSAGMDRWHAGELPDPRAREEGRRRGYDLSHKARQVKAEDLARPGLVLALDRGHREALRAMMPARNGPMAALLGAKEHAEVRLLRDYDPAAGPDADVADPYYGPDEGFAAMFDEIEATMPELISAVALRVQ